MSRRIAALRGRVDALAGVAWRAAPGLTLYCAALALAAGVLGVLYPIGFRVIVDGALHRDRRTLVLGVLVVSATFAASWTCRVVSGMAGSRLTDLANLSLATRIAGLVNEAPSLEHLERPQYLAQIENLRDQRRTLAGAPRQFFALLQSSISVGAVIVLLALIYPPVLLVPLLAVLPGLADRRASRIQKEADDALADGRRQLAAIFTLAATAAPARELRTFGVTDAVARLHHRLGDQVNRRALAAARRAAAWEALGWTAYALGFAAGVIVLVLRAAHGHTSPGEVVEAVSLIRRSQRQLGGATDTAGSFMTANITAGRLLWLERYVADATAGSSAAPPTQILDGIVLDDVGFVYPGRDEDVLTAVSLKLAAGTTVAVVGENGAGKTTLVKLLTGMYRATSGCIMIDGIDLATIDPVAWRASATGAFQDYLRLNMSLADGVGAGDLPRIVDQPAIDTALARAGGTSLVARMPEGAKTLLGPYVGGRSLSGGEWQRLALARGLMREQPLLVVLDEPTASLDAATEAELFARYRDAARRLAEKNGAITILVSHRFSTVRTADQIVVLERGNVLETGTHDELVARGGLYAELFELQARQYHASSPARGDSADSMSHDPAS
jgi:ATP-binding cassette, subfamily B, bacterial